MRMVSAVADLDKVPPVAVSSTTKPEVAPFLRSLRRMLDGEDRAILRWTPNGRAFEIHDMDRMMQEVLPKYFKHRKYTSFQRQLNYFSFRKWTKSKAVVCTFSNDCFMRDRPDLAWRITRKKSVHVSSYKHSSSAPRKPKAATTAAAVVASAPAKTNVKLEPTNPIKLEQLSVKLESSQFQPSTVKPTLPGRNPWKRDMAIRVPRVLNMFNDSGGGPFGSGRPFPSPTDMDLVLLENDMEPQRYYRHESVASLSLSEQDVDSLEWVDNFLPSLDAAPRHEEPVFVDNTVNVSALLRQPASHSFLQLTGDYASMTAM